MGTEVSLFNLKPTVTLYNNLYCQLIFVVVAGLAISKIVVNVGFHRNGVCYTYLLGRMIIVEYVCHPE